MRRPFWKLALLAGLSGILGFLSFPRAEQGYLAWAALVPLLAATEAAASARCAAGLGFLAGFLQWLGLLAWIPPVMTAYGGLPLAVAWLLEALLASVLSVYPAAACALARWSMGLGGRKALFIFPFAWVGLEAFRAHFILDGFPWLLAGYSQTRWLTLIQIADFAGVYGVSFLVVWVNAALAYALGERGRPAARWWPLGLGAAMVAGCLLYGRARLDRWSAIPKPYRVAMLQGNLAFGEPREVLEWKFGQGYLEMAGGLGDMKVDLLVLPEAPAALNFQFDTDYRRAMESLARRASLGMVLNNVHYREVLGPAHYYNSAYFLDCDGRERGRYDKIYLVPFGEYIPWRSIFFFAETVTKDVGSFTPGSEFYVAEMAGHRLNAIICFEAIFPQLSRVFALRGSGLFVNLTNDGWYGDSAAPYQHLQMARWRAIENRRFLLRATNSGITAVVEPTGRIQSATPLGQEAVCLGSFGFEYGTTFYCRRGEVFPILCAMIGCVMVVGFARRRIRLRRP